MKTNYKNYYITGMAVALILAAGACNNKKQMDAAKKNSVGHALAQCECEKRKNKKPPEDITLCTEQMMRADRYLKINFELGKFSDSAKAEVEAAGAQAYKKCMETP
jgi:hypothetical protein